MDTQTTQQTQQYERALKRARDEGCRIAGTSALDGHRAWVVINPSHDGEYIVRLQAAASQLTCNCPSRVPCKHRALCHEALERETHQARPTILGMQAARKSALQTALWN